MIAVETCLLIELFVPRHSAILLKKSTLVTGAVEGECAPQDSLHERGADCVLPLEATLDPDEHLVWRRWDQNQELLGVTARSEDRYERLPYSYTI